MYGKKIRAGGFERRGLLSFLRNGTKQDERKTVQNDVSRTQDNDYVTILLSDTTLLEYKNYCLRNGLNSTM